MLLEIQSEPDTQTDGNSSGRHAITRRETWASTNAGSARNLYWPKVHSMVRPPDRGTWINTRSKERTSELGPARAGPSAPASFPAAPDRVCEGTPLSVPTASEPDPPRVRRSTVLPTTNRPRPEPRRPPCSRRRGG